MPDSLSRAPKETVADLIRRHRRPLPAPAFATGADDPAAAGRSWRARAVAACHAEIAHRSRDFARVERALGLTFDRWLEPDCEQLGQFPHEAHAGAALVWLSHLQTHESEKRTPWSGVPFRSWPERDRTTWFAKRRAMWRGFVQQVERYWATRGLSCTQRHCDALCFDACPLEALGTCTGSESGPSLASASPRDRRNIASTQ